MKFDTFSKSSLNNKNLKQFGCEAKRSPTLAKSELKEYFDSLWTKFC